jgi:hypothetical protein
MDKAKLLLEELCNKAGKTEWPRASIIDHLSTHGLTPKEISHVIQTLRKVRFGVYDASSLKEFSSDSSATFVRRKEQNVSSKPTDNIYVPSSDERYVPWGNYSDIESIISSKLFFPTFITGLSGNGKTMMVEQACANLGRSMMRIQINPATDEEDLLGGFRLVNGDTVFEKGPVVKAMEAGAILLIDEIDRGTNKLFCLQGVLEGKPVLLKKTGELISPAPGFNVIATANTKGKGSNDGRFIAAQIIDDAFLERFTVTIEQKYPDMRTERKILVNHFSHVGVKDTEFVDTLLKWAGSIRKAFDNGGLNEVITTRRLCHIAETYSIFMDRKKALTLCMNKFDEDTKIAFLEFYSKHEGESKPETSKTKQSSDYDNTPF